MKKRVAIARALVMEPQLMLYDEPTSELDPVMGATISEIIATLKDEYHVTTIVVSHDRDLALSIADRVGILMNGKLRLQHSQYFLLEFCLHGTLEIYEQLCRTKIHTFLHSIHLYDLKLN